MKKIVYECDKCGKEVTHQQGAKDVLPEGWLFVFITRHLLWCAACVRNAKEPYPKKATAVRQ